MRAVVVLGLSLTVWCVAPGARAQGADAPAESSPPPPASVPPASVPAQQAPQPAPASDTSGSVIADPELSGTPLASGASAEPSAAASSDGVIADPELSGTASTAPPTSFGTPSGQDAEIRVVLRSRAGVDLQWQEPREDVLEWTQLALFEARVRRSERLAFSVGARVRHLFATRDEGTADANPARYELDAVPTALHADVGLTDSLHARVGYQGVFLGRFDVLGASNVLSRFDLRAGPTAMPEQSEIAQPALTLDWAASALELRAIYVPFFAPHMVNAFEGDYALAPSRQADVDEGLDGVAQLLGEDSGAQFARTLRSALTRSGQARFFEGGFSAFAPDPSLAHPQGALRLSTHGPAGELALSAATALEHMPTVYPADAPGAAPGTLSAVRYNRFATLAIDGALPLGPMQLGAEVAYSIDRTFIAVESGETPLPRRSDLLQAALRAEWVHGERWITALEASAGRVLADPGGDREWAFVTHERWLLAAVAFLAHAIPDAGLRLELGAGILGGPTYLITPRVELRLVDQLFAELGAYVIGGSGGRRSAADPGATLGAIYTNVDQAFVGLRWLP